MNKKYYQLIVLILLLSGCTTLGSVEREFNKIVLSDGVSKPEAKIIAQRRLLNSSSKDSYKAGSAKVYDSAEVLELDSNKVDFVIHDNLYEDYRKKLKFEESWYVSFKPKFLSFLSNYFLVVLDKKYGEVKYSHDSNAFEAIGQLMFAHIKPKLMSSMLIGKYYRENKQLPESIEQLRKFMLDNSESKTEEKETLEGYEIQKISDNRVKVKYVPEKGMQIIYDAIEETSPKLSPKGEFELEIFSEGEKTILKTYGDMDMNFELTDNVKIIGNLKNASNENSEEMMNEILDQIFE